MSELLDYDRQIAIMDAICHEAQQASNAVSIAFSEHMRPSAVYRPELSLDGNQYCALYGPDLMSGCAGFGSTAADAMADFDKNWTGQKAPQPRTEKTS